MLVVAVSSVGSFARKPVFKTASKPVYIVSFSSNIVCSIVAFSARDVVSLVVAAMEGAE